MNPHSHLSAPAAPISCDPPEGAPLPAEPSGLVLHTHRIRIGKIDRFLCLGFSELDPEPCGRDDSMHPIAEFASQSMAARVALALETRRRRKADAMGQPFFGELVVVEKAWGENPIDAMSAANRMDRTSIEYGRFFAPALPSWLTDVEHSHRSLRGKS